MSVLSGTREAPTTWPRDPAARQALQDWLEGGPEIELIGHGLDFRGADLNGIHFYHICAHGADFRGVNFRGSDLGGSWLMECDFSFANLDNALFVKAELADAKFCATSLRRTQFRKLDADRTDFGSADISQGLLSRSFRDASFRDATLTDVFFRDPILSGANLEGARVAGSHGTAWGPIRVVTDEGPATLDGADATHWFREQGAEVAVKSFADLR